MSIARIKKDDTVIVIAGEASGKTGRVLRVLPKKGKALVEGLNIVKKAVRRTEDAPGQGHIEREAPIDLSNLMPYDKESGKGVKIRRVREGDKTIRKIRSSGKSLN